MREEEEGLVTINVSMRKDYLPSTQPEAGMYLDGEAEGAYPNGTRIVKVEAEEGDGTSVGTGGVILSSHDVSDLVVEDLSRPVTFYYFVKFDDFPHPVGICDWKIGREGVP